MQYFFTKIRDLSLVRTRLSILCTDQPDEETKNTMFRLMTDIAEIVISNYNGTIEEEEEKNEDIFSTSMPLNMDVTNPAMVMYMTVTFQNEEDKELFIEDFIDEMMS